MTGLSPDVPAGGWRPAAVAICVPIKNEATLLPRLLDSLAAQADPGVETIFCFLLDGCTDRSEQVIRARATRVPFPMRIASVAAGAAPNAGLARQRAVAIAHGAFCDTDGLAILTTDGDTAVAPDWIAANLTALRDADVVTGHILRIQDRRDQRQDRLEAYLDRLYALRREIDPIAWETGPAHHCTGGASLAFRGRAYRDLGGFAPIVAGEDAAIVDTAHRIGLRVARDRRVIVHTSARRDGRATGGLASHLASNDREGPSLPLVGHPADALWQYLGHNAARMAFARIGEAEMVTALALRLGMSEAHVRAVGERHRAIEAFVTHVVPAAPLAPRTLSLDAAERELDAFALAARERAA